MPTIFWKTVVISAAIILVSTILGRFLALALPPRIQGSARFYLAPSLGLALLVVIASLVGRHVVIGASPLLFVLILALCIVSLFYETRLKQAFLQALAVSLLGLLCGGAILDRLLMHGALTIHNDAFTYLAHSEWLQTHAFAVSIDHNDVTPFTTQIYSYQKSGLRMGGSYLLALVQAATLQMWAYDVYPAVLISAVTSCCLAAGFPIARYIRTIPRATRMSLFAVPTFMVGGLMFGATSGFFPQTIGITLGASLLCLIGPVLRWTAIHAIKTKDLLKAAIPVAVLFSGLTFSYSEFMPFVVVTILASASALLRRGRTCRRICGYGFMVTCLSIAIINTELVRTIKAVAFQSHAVVGTPVDWSLMGFVGHAFGVHGGAWDGLHWAATNQVGTISFWIGFLILLIPIMLALLPWRWVIRGATNGELTPVVIATVLFFVGIIYFRYFVPPSFSVGKGASWSQFKLSDWAGPFVTVFVLMGFVKIREYLGNRFVAAATTFVVLCFVFTAVIPPTVFAGAFGPFITYYGAPRDLSRLFKEFRATVMAVCPINRPVFLALDGDDVKARQITVLYLPDRVLHSDWTNDVYFANSLPASRKKEILHEGDCVIEANAQERYVHSGTTIGPFRVGIFDGIGNIFVSSIAGAYGKESNGTGWWRWVTNKVEIKFDTTSTETTDGRTKVAFGYQGREKQMLTVKVVSRGRPDQVRTLNVSNDAPSHFEETFDIPPKNIEAVTIETNVQATALGVGDSRVAAWKLSNFVVTPVEKLD